MLKERLFNFLLILFIGIFFIYTINNPPTIVVKQSNIDQFENIVFINESN